MKRKPVILILGEGGQVGSELCRLLAPGAEVAAADFPHVDLEQPSSIRKIIRLTRPDVVVNAAAYTAVDRAESEEKRAYAINGTAPGIIAEESMSVGAALIHFSTDYVYDGNKSEPYTESDQTNPLSAYGRSKLAGDLGVLESGVPAIILRTSWVYGWRGNNFLRTMLRLFREKSELRIVDDQLGTPTWARVLAEVTAHIVSRAADDPVAFIRAHAGIYHATSRDATNWYEFAKKIAAFDPGRAEHVCRTLSPIPSTEYCTPAQRPMNSVLDNTKLQRTFSIELPRWDEPLKCWGGEVSLVRTI